ncbi:acyltransferase [Methylocystis sp. IM3]
MPNTGFLNGLRALAAFSVLACHVMIWSGWSSFGVPLLPGPGAVAKMAVDLFMILSGFLMAFNAHKRINEPMTRLDSWSKFYIRRFFRIAPGYYASLVVALLLSKPFLSGYATLADRLPGLAESFYNGKAIDYSATNILLHVTFLFGLFPEWSFSTQLPDWSLGLEMQFYVIFPLLTVVAMRWGVLRVCIPMVPLCLIATALLAPGFREPSLILFKLPVFYAGMLLFFASVSSQKQEKLALNSVALLLTLTQVQFYGKVGVLLVLAPLLIAFKCATPGNAVARQLDWAIGRVLDNRFARVGSDLSYPVYLFHGFFIAIIGGALFGSGAFVALDPHARTAILFVSVLVGTVGASIIVHRFVEKPGINAGKHLVGLLKRPEGDDGVAARLAVARASRRADR